MGGQGDERQTRETVPGTDGTGNAPRVAGTGSGGDTRRSGQGTRRGCQRRETHRPGSLLDSDRRGSLPYLFLAQGSPLAFRQTLWLFVWPGATVWSG